MAATLTLGEIRRLTADLPDETPFTIWDGVSWYNNIELTEEDVAAHTAEDGMPSIVLTPTGAVDTRQW